MRTLIAASLGYLVGSFPTADLVTRYAVRRNGEKAVDLRAAGTGNPGSLNAAKLLGWKWGAIILAGDMMKGALASLAGRAVAGDNGTYAAGSGAVAIATLGVVSDALPTSSTLACAGPLRSSSVVTSASAGVG